MTKDELISKQALLDALLAKMDEIDDKPEVVLGMAVAMGMIKAMPSALDQEPCEDCVSRIIKRMWNWRGKHTTSIDKVKMEQIIRDELPSVTPAEKVGRLVDTDDGHSVECSECGKWFFHGYLAKIEIKYCPTCGTKMQEVEE